MDLDRLKFVIKDEQGTTYKDCAKAIGRSVSYFNDRMNGKANFTIEEAEMLGNYLKLYNYEKRMIFFDEVFTREEQFELILQEDRNRCRNEIKTMIDEIENVEFLEKISMFIGVFHRKERENA